MRLALLLILQAGLLAAAAAANLERLNPDAVAYLRLARYYAESNWDLAVTAYWGPLLSWAAAPLILAGQEPWVAGRVVMALAALVFTLGCRRLFVRMRLDRRAVAAGTILAAAASIAWSVGAITPDLLFAGLLALAASPLLPSGWAAGSRDRWCAGLWGAAATLAKPAGLPMFFCLAGAGALLAYASGAAPVRRLVTALAATLASLLLGLLPWWACLAWKYERVVLASAGPINHAIVGPGAEYDALRPIPDAIRPPGSPASARERLHPLARGFFLPEAGRITAWEDPGALSYPSWSPLASAENLRHQLLLLQANYRYLIWQLLEFDALHIGWAAALAGLLFHRPWGRRMRREPWRLSGGFLLAACAIYLPVYAVNERYYFPVYPYLLAAALGTAGALLRAPRGGWGSALGMIVVGSFALSAVAPLPPTLTGLPSTQSRAAFEMARHLRSEAPAGPVAGDGIEGLYVAFLLDLPWLGCHGGVDAAARFKESGARLVIVPRDSSLAREISLDPAFRRIDAGSRAGRLAAFHLTP
ncbi:MAG: hypothetical protein ACT4PV_14705 [Planctomycetaceae bacterium]